MIFPVLYLIPEQSLRLDTGNYKSSIVIDGGDAGEKSGTITLLLNSH